ncbi:hypothetical protein [Providencia rettgeri]|uniref:hypothetical protein n=1 Tax=Providencia rettgeri TaxID=587 RepID=UPI0024473602|nr:hypothetical protein [Providencia rettgeri]MDH2379206.1 hypothetical protein [Providencia rettgeri]
MEFKGTPAPWFIEEYLSGDIALITNDGALVTILTARIDMNDMSAISAAPELLESLIRLRNKIASYTPDNDDDLDIVDAVIAKALGQQ